MIYLQKEIWKGLIYGGKDYSDWLEVSNLSRFRNPKTGIVRKKNKLKTGYWFISFSMGSRDKKKTIRCHKGVGETFIPNPENKPILNHSDGNKLNDSISNLEWMTHSENIKHAFDIGLSSNKTGIDSLNFKLKQHEVDYIIKNYKPRDRKLGARALGRKFNVSKDTILRVIKKIKYASLV